MRIDMPQIKNNTFTLRDITILDALDLYEFGKDFETTKYLTWGPLDNLLEAKLLISNFNLKRPLEGLPVGYAIVSNQTKKMIGMIEFHTYYEFENSAELGFILSKDFQNKGIMTRALDVMISLGFYHLGLDKIIIGHVDLNENCHKLIDKFHFKYEKTEYASFKLKDSFEYRNILYYSLYKEEYLKGAF